MMRSNTKPTEDISQIIADVMAEIDRLTGEIKRINTRLSEGAIADNTIEGFVEIMNLSLYENNKAECEQTLSALLEGALFYNNTNVPTFVNMSNSSTHDVIDDDDDDSDKDESNNNVNAASNSNNNANSGLNIAGMFSAAFGNAMTGWKNYQNRNATKDNASNAIEMRSMNTGANDSDDDANDTDKLLQKKTK